EVVWRTEIATAPRACPAPGERPFSPPALVAAVGDTVVFALQGLVVQLDAATGAERWRREVTGSEFGVTVKGVVIDRAGGVVLGGGINGSDDHLETDFLVAGLDGATGAELWRQVLAGTPGPPDVDDPYTERTEDEAVALALDGAGNVLVMGVVQ